jgi:hypothetical protein
VGKAHQIEAHHGGGCPSRERCRSGCGPGVIGIDGWVGEQHTAGAELVGDSAGPRSGQRKPAPVGCSVADRAGGGKLTGMPKELPPLPNGVGDEEEVLWGGLLVACSACRWCVAAARRTEQRSKIDHGV